MNNNHNTHHYLLLVVVLVVTPLSCDLTKDLDKLSPPHRLVADNAITNAQAAEQALTGAYSTLQSRSTSTRDDGDFILISRIPAYLGITGHVTGNIIAGLKRTEIGRLITNNPSSFSTEGKLLLDKAYVGVYNLVASCNFVIEEVAKAKKSIFKKHPERQSEIIAEAKALRALGHFYLLRLWGQFYDLNSKHGIVLKTSSKTNKTLPRNTVVQCYESILSDLDDAIKHAPTLRDNAKYYVNKTFAQGLKAKVLLYQGKYAEAARLSKEVMYNSPPEFSLAKTFNEIFDFSSIKLFSNTEAIFCVYSSTNYNQGEAITSAGWGVEIMISKVYEKMATSEYINVQGKNIYYDTARVKFVSPPNNKKYPIPNRGFGNVGVVTDKYETMYHLRMAEIYLIYAEAEARSKNSVTTEALNALNSVRGRKINIRDEAKTVTHTLTPYPPIKDLDQFLELVRIEKLMELVGEMGEHWFDLIRYDYADGTLGGGKFKVEDVKPTAKNPDKYILPIPHRSVLASNGIVIQNPNY